MKIAMIVHAYYLKDARVRRYAEVLAQRGDQVDVFCLRDGEEPIKQTHLGVRIHRIACGRLRGGKASYLLEYGLSSLLFLFALIKWSIATKTRCDVVHVHNMPDFLVFCALPQKLLGSKIILDIHDLMPEVFQSKYALGREDKVMRLLKLEERLSIGFSSAVITANHAFRDLLLRRGYAGDKVTVVMNAPDEKFVNYQPTRSESESETAKAGFHIMYVGTLAERYGIDFAIRATAKLRREHAVPGLRFSILPKTNQEGAYAERIREEITRTGLDDIVSFLEPVAHDAMPGVIEQADVLLYTPVPDVHMDIALSLKIPEFMAIGRPVVASRLEVHERYFGDQSMFLFEPGNIDQCVEQLMRVYSDPQEVARRRAGAKQALAKIAWPVQRQAYLDLLEKLTSSTRRAVDYA